MSRIGPGMGICKRSTAALASWNKAASRCLWTTGYLRSHDGPVTPDYVTPVDTANIKLQKPKRMKLREKNMEGGRQRGNDRNEIKGSLIPDTLQEMEKDQNFQETARRLRDIGAEKMSLEERKRRRRALDELGVPSFRDFLKQRGLELTRTMPSVFQLNIGLYCNQACNHCHVESSPKRKEMMDEKVANRCLELLQNSPSITTFDLTGGAPELNAQFRYLVEKARNMRPELDIIDRCNLTALLEPGQEDLHDFLASNRVRVVASLPCYSPKNVNMQRGNGVFARSIEALKRLNDVGYGRDESNLFLDLVYNPLGAFLPPPQDKLEEKYKEELFETFGISFNNLFTITNMPIKRFADFLYRRGELKDYMDLLVRNFNPDSIEGVMCRSHVSVGWDGRIYDCDFNQQLSLPVPKSKKMDEAEMKDALSIFDVTTLDELVDRKIVLAGHCFGCTAGMGSSCQGTTI